MKTEEKVKLNQMLEHLAEDVYLTEGFEFPIGLAVFSDTGAAMLLQKLALDQNLTMHGELPSVESKVADTASWIAMLYAKGSDPLVFEIDMTTTGVLRAVRGKPIQWGRIIEKQITAKTAGAT